MQTPTVDLKEVDFRVLPMRTRFPFHYGIAQLTALPHLFVRCTAEIDGEGCEGVAAEGLPPKWFTKDPATTFEEDLPAMFEVIRQAAALFLEPAAAPSFFDLWHSVYQAQLRWAEGRHPPLLANLGTSLLERALLDAFCRATGTTLAAALRNNTLGVRPGEIHPQLADAELAELLPATPAGTIIARHTVGLADPLRDADIPDDERLDDGLPQSLAACVATYGLTHFKIKLRGDLEADLDRLETVHAVLEEAAPDGYQFTLDGNEQFLSAEAFREHWEAYRDRPAVRDLLGHLLFVEQPVHRDAALAPEVGEVLRSWEDAPPLIIDESDATANSLRDALGLGYAGTSHKNCKGVIKGAANAALIASLRGVDTAGGHPPVLSGEDLANVGPCALLQDLAAMAALGVAHVERNGHHYFRGLSQFPDKIQDQLLEAHGDLHHRHPAGFAALRIDGGRLNLGSVNAAPFGLGPLPDLSPFTPLDEWDVASLGA